MVGAANTDPKLQGNITKTSSTDRTMVSISLGSAAGLKEGDTLHVYRLEPKAEYLGKLRVVIVEANAAVGRLQEGMHGEVRPGDRVSSSLDKSLPSVDARTSWQGKAKSTDISW